MLLLSLGCGPFASPAGTRWVLGCSNLCAGVQPPRHGVLGRAGPEHRWGDPRGLVAPRDPL